MSDLLIRGVSILDGSGRDAFQGDLHISKGRIVSVLPPGGGKVHGEVIEGDGLTLSPGFIDTHSHSDLVVLEEPPNLAMLRQGVTTTVVGNCGLSVAPVTEESASTIAARMGPLTGAPGVGWSWRSLGEYLEQVSQTPRVFNLLTLVGHNTVRETVMGPDNRAPSSAEQRRMEELVEGAMRDGAFGLSTGLIYAPGVYAERGEIVRLARVAARHGGIYCTHMRGEGDTLLDAVEESLSIAREAQIPLHISHLKAHGRGNWHKQDALLARLRAARADGMDVTFDQYPYIASSTSLSMLLPPWVHEGGVATLVKRLRDPAIREKITQQFQNGCPGWQNIKRHLEWDEIILSSTVSQRNKDLEGKSIAEIARLRGKSPLEVYYDILVEEDGLAGMIAFSMSEENVRAIMREDYGMVGSDGIYGGKPHPRAFGTFVRILGKYVREEGVLTLPQAVRKMTRLPAERFGLRDRGRIEPGAAADLVLFDPATVADGATFEDPFRPPKGIHFVIVNGVVSIRHGQFTGALGGRVLRHGAQTKI